jgi:hypothetical protein
MRTKPVCRDEVCILRGWPWEAWRITTLPADSVRRVERSLACEAIPKLWAPLLRRLSKLQAEQWQVEGAKRESDGKERFEKPGPVELPHPGDAEECRHCGTKFYTVSRRPHAYCSDRCAVARATKARSERRAADRNDTCDHCGKPIRARRSTMKFCSIRCRVAAHRAQ